MCARAHTSSVWNFGVYVCAYAPASLFMHANLHILTFIPYTCTVHLYRTPVDHKYGTCKCQISK
jgi:hypothetical protein